MYIYIYNRCTKTIQINEEGESREEFKERYKEGRDIIKAKVRTR